MYAKSIDTFTIGRLPRTEEANARYQNPDNDPRGIWMSDNMTVKTYSPDCDYPITTPSGRVVEPPAGRCWRLSKKAFFERLQDNRIWFGSDGNGVPRIKRFLSELKFDGMAPTSILFYKEVGHSQDGAKEVAALFDGKSYFDGPKPVRLLQRLMTLANLSDGDLVLDFFSGSGTTAHALLGMQLQKPDRYRFILVQLPEPTDPNRDAYKAGYYTLCDIGEERIRRAGDKIAEEVAEANKQPKLGEEPKKLPDIGFRVFRLDESGIAKPKDAELLIDRRKDGRSDLDIIFEVMLKWGYELTYPIEKTEFAGYGCYSVAAGDLICCMEPGLTVDALEAIVAEQPRRVFIMDSVFGYDDSLKLDALAIFKHAEEQTQQKIELRTV